MDYYTTKSLGVGGVEGFYFFFFFLGSPLSLKTSLKLLSSLTPAMASVFTQHHAEDTACHYTCRLFILSCLGV